MDRKNSVKKILIECMPQETDLTEISEDTNIYEDLQYDSLAIVELLTAIEEEFGVDFTELMILRTCCVLIVESLWGLKS